MKKPNDAALGRIRSAKPKARWVRKAEKLKTAGTYPMDCKQKRLLKRRLMGCDPYCFWCREQLTSRTATLDHVLPISVGGTHEDHNIVLACGPCNKIKGSIYWPLSMKGHRYRGTEAQNVPNEAGLRQ